VATEEVRCFPRLRSALEEAAQLQAFLQDAVHQKKVPKEQTE
jgi:hypothetical protein